MELCSTRPRRLARRLLLVRPESAWALRPLLSPPCCAGTACLKACSGLGARQQSFWASMQDELMANTSKYLEMVLLHQTFQRWARTTTARKALKVGAEAPCNANNNHDVFKTELTVSNIFIHTTK
ncbi:TPA: hypothetical protein ACH3X2_008225 [Trebouxia sp. C0005]